MNVCVPPIRTNRYRDRQLLMGFNLDTGRFCLLLPDSFDHSIAGFLDAVEIILCPHRPFRLMAPPRSLAQSLPI